MKPTLLAGILVLLSAGCVPLTIQNKTVDGQTTTFKAWLVQYPWQDSAKSVEKMTLSAGTNKFTASLKGMEEGSTGATNLVTIVGNAETLMKLFAK